MRAGPQKETKGTGEPAPERQSFLIRLHSSNALFYVFIASFVLFLITRFVLFAVLTGLSLIGYFVLDIAVGVKRQGLIKELKELAIAVVLALAIWYGLILALGTPSPISAIYSCSMLPRFERGDMIILQGVRPADIAAPEIVLTQDEFAGIYGRAHKPCNTTGVISYICSTCTRISSSTKEPIGLSNCTREIEINGALISENFSNDVIVYIPTYVDGTPYGGDIIHRVFAKIRVDGDYFFLTKGDNNDLFDTSAFHIIREQDVKGRVLLRIPWIGYLKLFISGSFIDPTGCEKMYAHNI